MRYEALLRRLPNLVNEMRKAKLTRLDDALAVGEAIAMILILNDVLCGIKEVKDDSDVSKLIDKLNGDAKSCNGLSPP